MFVNPISRCKLGLEGAFSMIAESSFSLAFVSSSNANTGETIYKDAVVVQQRPSVGCNHIFPHSCSNNIPSMVSITAHWQSSFQTPRSRTTAERSNFKRPILTVKWTQRWVLLRHVEMFIPPIVYCVAESGGSASLWTAGSQDTTEDKAGGITNTGAA